MTLQPRNGALEAVVDSGLELPEAMFPYKGDIAAEA
jgi:hypothetical protein